MHPNARLTSHGRALLAERIRSGWTITAAAGAAGVSRQTGSKWRRRARSGEVTDRRSAVQRQARAHAPELVARLCARRGELRVGPHVLAWEVWLAPSTAYAILRRRGLLRPDRRPQPAAARRATPSGAGSAGTGSTWRSTTTPASPMRRSCPTSPLSSPMSSRLREDDLL